MFAVALLAAACGDTGGAPTSATAAPPGSVVGSDDTSPPTEAPRPAVGMLPDGPSALDDMRSADLPEPLVDPDQIISGGPPPDGIPPIDEPEFLQVIDHLDLLPADEPVVALEVNGDARAYPVRILIWHEIVNDTVGDTPVSITYCPLCNSAVTYVRVVDGVETTFGTSGRLYASALVMYDRATESLWTHFDGRAVVGVLTGTELEPIPSPLMSWDAFRSTYPDGLVLDETRTGHRRNYGVNPYTGYDNPDSFPFLFVGDVDARERAMTRVVGIEHEGGTVAVSLDALAGDGPSVTTVSVADTPLVILWEPGQSTALESTTIDGGRDVGTVGVFLPELEGESVTLNPGDDDRFVDAETGSTWTIAGVAIAGPRSGMSLRRVTHLDTFWFAWSTYQPDTVLVGVDD